MKCCKRQNKLFLARDYKRLHFEGRYFVGLLRTMAEIITDDRALLLERTLQKNEEMLEENRKLREELKTREQDNNRVLQDVLTQLRTIQQTSQQNAVGKRGQKKRRTKIQVPTACRVSTVYE